MHIGLTKLFENDAPNIEFNIEERLRLRSIGLNWDEKGEIKRAIVVDKDNKDEEDP